MNMVGRIFLRTATTTAAHSFREIVAAVWVSGYRYYSENPLDLAALVISLIALGVSSAGIVIAILSPSR